MMHPEVQAQPKKPEELPTAVIIKKDHPKPSIFICVHRVELGKISMRNGNEFPIISQKTYLGRKGFNIDTNGDDRVTYYGISDSHKISRIQAIIESMSAGENSERYFKKNIYKKKIIGDKEYE